MNPSPRAAVVQFGLGMILNLYVPVPSSDTHAGYVQEVTNGPFALTVRILLGVVLLGKKPEASKRTKIEVALRV